MKCLRADTYFKLDQYFINIHIPVLCLYKNETIMQCVINSAFVIAFKL